MIDMLEMGAYSPIFLLRQKLRSFVSPGCRKDPTQGTGQGCVEGDREQKGKKEGTGGRGQSLGCCVDCEVCDVSYSPPSSPDGFIKVSNLLLVSCLYVGTRLVHRCLHGVVEREKAKGKDLCAQRP